MLNRFNLINVIAIINIIVAIEIFLFWLGFYTEFIFPIDILAPRIENFEGYYAWETSFTLPDFMLAAATLYAATRILKDNQDQFAKTMLASCAGGMMFLGVLDFSYDAFHGMYQLDHIFSYLLMSIGIGLPLLGAITIWVIHKSSKFSVTT